MDYDGLASPFVYCSHSCDSFELTNQMARLWGDVDCTGFFLMLLLSSLADTNGADHDCDARRYGLTNPLRGVWVLSRITIERFPALVDSLRIAWKIPFY